MFAVIKLFGCLFFVLFIVMYLVLCMAFHVDDDTAIIVSANASAVISIIVTTLLKASDTKCQSR